MKDDLQQIAITLISQYGNEAQTIAMLRAAEHAVSLNQDEWLKWEKIVQILETIDEKSPLDS
tara:strand:+ start:430 stop:615 length:186 start_codon:yes stop_codon:yes gene_type:complete